MTLYEKDLFLEGPDFPFAAFPYATLPTRPARPHSHDFVELVFVAEGHGEHLFSEQSYPISKGDVFVIPPGAEHDYRVRGAAPLEIFNVLFMPSFLAPLLESLAEVTPFLHFFYVEPFFRKELDFHAHLKLSLAEEQAVRERLDRLVEEYRTKPLGYRIAIKGLLAELLVYLSRCYGHSAVTSGFHPDENNAIRQLCGFLEAHYAQPIHLEQVCRMCGMSQTVFTARFKQLTGRTFTEYRNELRVRASLRLLRETAAKIVDVAQEVGVGDVSHFNRLFKSHMGMTPKEYRSRHRQQSTGAGQS
ncbi:AraC family transcriptional regulator [Paenibacillus sp. YN15]|uniref:AraC family transcriptional regulator n=1 Tax=Paenibacillus sp. YN15 TaxID=1742774 RepID=UPI0015EB4941|nr:AraC family transcriptional regulator [Paenibacillus sp. YN15]